MRLLPCLAAAASALVIVLPLDAQAIVIPDLGTSPTANSSSSYPWSQTSSSLRVQYVYDTSNFTAAAAPAKIPILIKRLRFRAADTATTTTTWTGGTYGGITIKMSSAAVDHASVTTTFSSNHGTDMKTVFSGSVNLTAGSGTGSGVPGPWYADITLATPFSYDPTQNKDLLIDIASDGTKWTPTSGTTTTNAVTSGSAWKAYRVYNLTSHTATTGSVQANVGLVCEINYTPQSGLFAGFTASPTTGGQNLKVVFKDQSFSSDPGGIQSWAWDFDGDNKTDSTLQNPTFTYKCGKFSPSLTVTDKANKPSTSTQKDLIKAGLVTAAFRVTGATRGMVPFQASFADLSTGPVTTYQWDFDGDNKVDSTLQNPTFTYTKDGTYDVKLTVIGPCDQDSDTQKGIITVGETCITTLFTGGNGLTANGCGNLFDVSVKNPNGLKITTMDISTRAAAPTMVSIDVYITPNTWSGNEGNANKWVKVSTGSAASKGGTAGTPTPIDVTDFFLPPGRHGMYIVFLNGGTHYTSGTATNNLYRNADLDLLLGASQNVPFSGSVISPRIWNGSICYEAKDKAASGAYGFGCPGTSKTPRLSLSADPVIGTTVKFNITDMVNSPAGVGLLFVGLKNTQTDLTAYSMPNCALFNEALRTVGFVNVAGTGSISSRIPNDSGLVGAQFFMQSANADIGANPLGVAASAGLAARVGNK